MTTGIVYLAVDCFCAPPNRLTTNETKQSDRCEVCGCEILTGAMTTEPRLRLVEDE